MFDDLEDGVHMSLWAAAALTTILLAGLLGGLWVREWRLERAAATQANLAPLAAQAPRLKPAEER